MPVDRNGPAVNIEPIPLNINVPNNGFNELARNVEMRVAGANPFPMPDPRWVAKPIRRLYRTGPAVLKIRTVSQHMSSITKDYLITGGACLDAWRNSDLRNDIDVFVKATPEIHRYKGLLEGLGWIYLRDKKLDGDYGPTGVKLPASSRPVRPMKDITAIDQFAVRDVGTVDIIVVNNLEDVIPSFDINLSKYFWNPETNDIDERFVKNPFEVSLERVSSPQNFPRHIERLQKYAKVTGFPITCRIDNFEEAFL